MLGLKRSGVAVVGALMLAGGAAGCGSLNTNRVDCNVVKLQSEAGRSNAEIASALGVTQDEVASCHPPGAMPAEMSAPPEAAPTEGSSGGGEGSESKPPM